MVREAAEGPKWVIEGVYGWLAEEAAPRATALIWLCLPWAKCEAGIRARGPWQKAKAGALEDLIEWARDYEGRQTPTSLAGHRRLFEDFAGEKLMIRSRAQANELIQRLQEG